MIKVECVVVKFYFGPGLGALIYPISLTLFYGQVAGFKSSLKLAYAFSAKFKRIFATFWRANSTIASFRIIGVRIVLVLRRRFRGLT